MMHLADYIGRFDLLFPDIHTDDAWQVTAQINRIVTEKMAALGPDYTITEGVAIHRTASVDTRAIVKGPAIISAQCFVGANASLRGGIFLDENVSIGPACEIKSSFIFANSAIAHLNFVGDSLVGSFVNLEAGAVVANHYNERKNKNITVTAGGRKFFTGVEKFGALIGDHAKIGANAVLSPGSVLPPDTVVGRLQLIEQNP
ncbi:MAG TPA: LpxA family transferase [Chryseosolibacter sp.]